MRRERDWRVSDFGLGLIVGGRGGGFSPSGFPFSTTSGTSFVSPMNFGNFGSGWNMPWNYTDTSYVNTNQNTCPVGMEPHLDARGLPYCLTAGATPIAGMGICPSALLAQQNCPAGTVYNVLTGQCLRVA